MFVQVFLSLDSGPWGFKITFSGGCVIPNLGHFEKSKMAATVVADAGIIIIVIFI